MWHPRYPAFILFLLSQLKGQLPSTSLQIHLLFDFSHPPALGIALVHILGSKVLFTIGPLFLDWIFLKSTQFD